MDYLELLKRSHRIEIAWTGEDMSRLVYLNHIFDFTTDDDNLDELFVKKALEVCEAISNRTTFDYIHKSDDHYLWFIAMCNMPFFVNKLNCGTSIRGAWWDHGDTDFHIKSTGLHDENEEQILELKLNRDEWKEFIAAMFEFAGR